jgi:hypothetical protein
VKHSIEQRVASIENSVADSYGSGIMSRLEQRLSAVQDDQIRNQETFKHAIQMSIKEQIDMQNSALMSQNSQMRELWDREANARHSSVENYKQLLMQERTGRDVMYRQLDERLQNLEMNPRQTEVIVQRPSPPQFLTEILPPVVTTAAPTFTTTGSLSPRGSSVVIPMQVPSTTRIGAQNLAKLGSKTSF